MQWNKIKVSVHTVNIWHFTELKEKRKKIESRRTAKKLAFGIFVDLWICENWNILYRKMSECFATDTNTKRMYWKKSKKYSAKKKTNKKKSNVWKNREKIKTDKAYKN